MIKLNEPNFYITHKRKKTQKPDLLVLSQNENSDMFIM